MLFEEFTPDFKAVTPTRTFTFEDQELFVKVSGLDNAIFTSDRAAQAAGHKGRLVPGPLILSAAMGLIQKTGAFDHVVAVLEFDQLKFLKSLYPGDSLTVSIRVLESRPTKNPGRGLVVLAYSGLDQNGGEVLSCRANYLFKTRAAQRP